MALTTLSFRDWDANDFHVVRGVPAPRLAEKVTVRDDTVAPHSFRGDNPPPHIRLRFQAQFQPEGPQAPDVTSGHGVRVNQTTGLITVEAPPAGRRRLHSFLVTISAHDTNTSNVRTLTVRVHAHDAITRAWMTPPILRIRPDGLYKFSLFAEFDDEVIGDISNWGSSTQMTWSLIVQPPGDPGDIEMYNQSLGWFRGRKTGAKATMSVAYAGLTWPHPPPTGTVDCVESWATPRELVHVAGKGPQHWQANDVSNVLFIPDGFVKSEQDQFATLVRSIVHKLLKSPILRPFDLLGDAMNYWMAFVASPESGVNVLFEVREDPGTSRYQAVPFPVKPSEDAPTWSLEQLIHEVGLPVASDAGRNLEHSTEAGPPILKDWQEVYGPKVTEQRVTGKWKAWLALASRTLLNERDTLLGLGLGSRPRAAGNALVRTLKLRSDERAGIAALNELLVNLRHRGQPVGSVWRIAGPDSPFLPGKDRGLVCILSRTRLSGGSNLDDYYTSSLFRADQQVVRPSATAGVDIVPVRIKAKLTDMPSGEEGHPHVDFDDPPFEAVGTVAHETAHSLHLGDEYGEQFDETYRAPLTPIASLAAWNNLQEQGSLLTPTGALDATRVKWGRWHRIEKAGVLAEDPAPIAGGFRLTLKPGQATVFRKDDLVRIRTRPLGPDARVSHVLKVTSPAMGNQAHLEVTVLYEGWTSPIDFEKGSLLMKMLRWPFRGLGTNLGSELTLMAENIRQHIDATGLPLNARPGRALGACDLDNDGQQGARNLPDGLPKCQPRHKSRIVGLFEGGSRYHCEVYHPTGACIMRSDKNGDEELLPFCPVCRYVLVDLVDPTKHGIIDGDYAKIYPDPRT